MEKHGKVSNKPAVSEEVQQLVLDCYDYFYKSISAKYDTITKITQELKLPRKTINRIFERGRVKISGNENILKKTQFSKIDNF